MNIAHLFIGGNIGGIECLCKNYISRSMHNHVIIVLWGSGPIIDDFKNDGIKVYDLKLSSKRIVSVIFRVEQICNKEKIDIIVAEHEAIVSHIALYCMKKINIHIKTVVYAHCHANDMCRIEQKRGLQLRKYILSKSIRTADTVIAISYAVKRSLVDILDIESDKIIVIYNGIDINKLSRGQMDKRDRSKYEIIYIGRLIKEKGVQTIIAAMEFLDENYHLSIIGDGKYRKTLEGLSFGSGDKITFYGMQRNIVDILKNADMFIHVPNWEEGFGITVVEAMAAGKICIVGDKGAMRELIDDNIDGYIIESGNAMRLADKIKEVTEKSSNERNIEMIKRAQKKAEKFSIERYTKNMDKFLEQIGSEEIDRIVQI